MKQSEKAPGISINAIINVLFGTSIVLTICITMLLIGLYRANQSISLYTADYSDCENAVSQFKEASAFLTQRARMYVETGDLDYMRAYGQEIVNDRRREDAVEIISQKSIDIENEDYYVRAMQYSEALKEIEIHAMKLVVVAEGDENKVIVIGDVKNYQLSMDELELPKGKQIEKARQLLYDKNYTILQDGFSEATNALHKNILSTLDERTAGATQFHRQMVLVLIIFICVFFVLIFFSFISLRESLLTPVLVYIDCIDNGLRLPPRGAREMQKFAEVYNEMFEPIDKKE